MPVAFGFVKPFETIASIFSRHAAAGFALR
jgi:hypothetical protein